MPGIPATPQEYEEVYNPLAFPFVLLGTLAITACMLVVTLFAIFPQLRTFPASIIMWTCVVDTLYVCKSLSGAIAWFVVDRHVAYKRSFHLIDDDCWSAALYGNFFGNASMAWNACWCVNFILELSRPLQSTEQYARWYHVFAWGLPVVTTAIMAMTESVDLSGDLTCWTADSSVNVWLTNVIVLLVSILAIVSLLNGIWSFATRATLARSLRVFCHHGAYVCVFVGTWVFVMTTLTGGVVMDASWKYIAANPSVQALLVGLIRLTEPDSVAVLAHMFHPKQEEYLPLLATTINGSGSGSGSVQESLGSTNSEMFGVRRERRIDVMTKLLIGLQSFLAVDGCACDAENDPWASRTVPCRDTPIGKAADCGQGGWQLQGHCAGSFLRLRELAGVSNASLRARLSPEAGVTLKSSPAKSGAFMCFSGGNLYIVKTVTKTEVTVLLDLLPALLQHFRDAPGSLIVPILGCFTLTGGRTRVDAIVMSNLLFTSGGSPPSAVYDLKGSSVSRRAASRSRGSLGSISSVLLDEDFQRDHAEGVHVNDKERARLLEAIEEDSTFLMTNGIMDYSMLIGEWDHEVTRTSTSGEQCGRRHRVISKNGKAYQLGIIDFLQRYDLGKKLERGAKSLRHTSMSADISAVNPATYQERFSRKLRSTFAPTTL